MASKTSATEMRRLKRNKGMGRDRKNNLKNHGSTKSAAVLFGDTPASPKATRASTPPAARTSAPPK